MLTKLHIESQRMERYFLDGLARETLIANGSSNELGNRGFEVFLPGHNQKKIDDDHTQIG